MLFMYERIFYLIEEIQPTYICFTYCRIHLEFIINMYKKLIILKKNNYYFLLQMLK